MDNLGSEGDHTQQSLQSSDTLMMEKTLQITLRNVFLDLSAEQPTAILHGRARGPVAVPALRIDTNKDCKGPDAEVKDEFRAQLLRNLQKCWCKESTKAKVLELARVSDDDVCALVGGFTDTNRFEQPIAGYTEAQECSGNQISLHSYVDLANHPDFLNGSEYSDAFAHSLLDLTSPG